MTIKDGQPPGIADADDSGPSGSGNLNVEEQENLDCDDVSNDSEKGSDVEEKSSKRRHCDDAMAMRDELDFEEEREEGEEGEDEGEDVEEATATVVVEEKDVEEGEVTDDDDEDAAMRQEPKSVCRFFNKGQCTWGVNCRFLHPGVSDKGNYNMFAPPKAAPAPAADSTEAEEVVHKVEKPKEVRRNISEVPPAFETPWERGLRQCKEMIKRASKRKESDADFEEKRFNLTIGQAELDRENDYYTRPASPVFKERIEPMDITDPFLDPYEKQAIRHLRGGHFENFEVRYSTGPPRYIRGGGPPRPHGDKYAREIAGRIPHKKIPRPPPPPPSPPLERGERATPRKAPPVPPLIKVERRSLEPLSSTLAPSPPTGPPKEAEHWADPWARRKTPPKALPRLDKAPRSGKEKRSYSHGSTSRSRSRSSSRSSAISSVSGSSKSPVASSRSRSRSAPPRSPRRRPPPGPPPDRHYPLPNFRGNGGMMRGHPFMRGRGFPPMGPFMRPPMMRYPHPGNMHGDFRGDPRGGHGGDPRFYRPPFARGDFHHTPFRGRPFIRGRYPMGRDHIEGELDDRLEEHKRPVDPYLKDKIIFPGRPPIPRRPDLPVEKSDVRKRSPPTPLRTESKKPRVAVRDRLVDTRPGKGVSSLRERVDVMGRSRKETTDHSRSRSRSPIRRKGKLSKKFSLSRSRSVSVSGSSSGSSRSRSRSISRSASSLSRSSSSGSAAARRMLMAERRKMTQGTVSYAQGKGKSSMDIVKMSGQKQQIKLTLKQPALKRIDKPLALQDDDSGESDPGLNVNILKKRKAVSPPSMPSPIREPTPPPAPPPGRKSINRRDELLKQLRAVEDAIARKRSKVM